MHTWHLICTLTQNIHMQCTRIARSGKIKFKPDSFFSFFLSSAWWSLQVTKKEKEKERKNENMSEILAGREKAWNFFNYLLGNFLSAEHPLWQSGSDSMPAQRGHAEQRGGGRLGCVKQKKRKWNMEGDYSFLSAVRMGGQGGEPPASGLNDLVLVERSLIQHLRSPQLLVLFSLFQN